MTLDPWTIIRSTCADGEPKTEADLIRHFMVGGYGEKRAKYWIRQYVKRGLLLLKGPNQYAL